MTSWPLFWRPPRKLSRRPKVNSQPFSFLQPGDIFQQGRSPYQKFPPVQWDDPVLPFANAISLQHGSLTWTGDKVEIERMGYQELALQDGTIKPARLEDTLDILPARDGHMDMMSEKRNLFNEDPAGWTQVGLAISAFNLAIMAFGDVSKVPLLLLLLSLLVSMAYVLSLTLDSILKRTEHRDDLPEWSGALLFLSVSFLYTGVFLWVGADLLGIMIWD